MTVRRIIIITQSWFGFVHNIRSTGTVMVEYHFLAQPGSFRRTGDMIVNLIYHTIYVIYVISCLYITANIN